LFIKRKGERSIGEEREKYMEGYRGSERVAE